MKKITKKLKALDTFQASKGLTMVNKKHHSGEKETYGSKASKVGGVFTLLLYSLLTLYFFYLTQRMYNGYDDNINMLIRANELEDGDQEIDIGKSRLLPSLNIVTLNNNANSEIFKNDHIDMDLLETFVHIRTVV